MTKPKQYQNTTELDSRHRTTMTEHTIELNRISSAIEAEQQDDSSVVAIKSCELEISCKRGYYPLACLGHVTVTRSQANLLFDYYYDDLQHIARWLTMLKRPKDMLRKEYQMFKNKATRYSIQD